MDNRVSVVLEKSEVFADVCGSNDYNLTLIERLLGSRILCHGNELYLESADANICKQFQLLVSRLAQAIEDGMPSGPELIMALYADISLPEGAIDNEHFKEACIVLPGGSRVYPRTTSQLLYLHGLVNHHLSIVVGPAGTGKTYLAVAWALQELLCNSKRKLVLTRPVVEAGESLGYLPGDLVQKISPYLRPLYDAIEMLLPYSSIKKLEESRSIEVAPLAYMRGRSLNNCVVILDEAQNTTKEQMKMFLTRLGENSKTVVTGDITQIDLQRKGESGLVHALRLLSSIEGIFICRLDASDVVRSGIARKIIEAYEQDT